MRKCLDCDKELVDAKGPKKRCDICNKEYRKLYWRIRENKPDRKAKNKKRNQEWRQKNPDKVKEYAIKHTNKWRKENREIYLEKKRKWNKHLYENNINYKLGGLLRTRIWSSLKKQGLKKKDSTMSVVGCSKEELIKHLESQFKEGMSWENWSLNGWHIDHIRPCSSFDLSDPAQVKECFHYSNLQPLWAIENLKKSDSWEADPQDDIFF
jgi:hypothetical protein